MVVTEISIIHHVVIVLLLVWLLNSYSCCHPLVYFVSLIYLYQVHERYSMRLRRKLQFEERKAANQRRVLTDSETVRWLNHAVAKMWPICIEQIISQRIFLPIIPWFLDKYKPWTVKRATVQHLYLGRRPPMFTDIRVLRESTDDDHLVLELGLNFLTADDMSAILVAKLRRRLGFGLVTKMHLTGMHVEGKVLVGVKFLRSWPFIGRLRVCFAEPPYFQMTVKPIFHHGLDVTELPGIAGWLDNLLAIAFEETLVEPNMLVVDLEKFISPQPENWFSVDAKEPVAHVNIEVIEAAELKPSDLNGLADPYVKGNLGPYRFKTQVQKKTLSPKWLEEFKVPICSWDLQNMLAIEVRDKDHFVDDLLGTCSVNISDLRDGQRHDMWLPLENVKMGRLHLAITIIAIDAKGRQQTGEDVKTEGQKPDPSLQCELQRPAPISTSSMNESQKLADTFEAIDVKGQKETGIWVHHPGSEVSQAWEPRKGKSRHTDTQILSQDTPKSSRQSSVHGDTSSDDENKEGHPTKRGNIFERGLHKLFHRRPKTEDRSNSFGHTVSSPHANVKPVHVKRVGVNLVMGDGLSEPPTAKTLKAEGGSSNEGSGAENSGKHDMKDRAKNMFRRSARHLKHKLSRKGSDKFVQKSEDGGPVDSDYSDDDDSISSSLYDSSAGGIQITSSFISRAVDDEAEPEEHVEAVLTDTQREVSEESTTQASLVEPDGQNVVMNSSSVGNEEDQTTESLNPESLKEKVGGEGMVEAWASG